ncbi:phosphoribosyltransferase family protein [Neobacillus cucumis]|uniref:phosphoribosyltransferase family protein n=1 Tax=Neobacillus cucumis TaxID=1740721 RepID=UPI0018DF9776|nr:phosphoribosyltransferase family protein [Neobacillus cucumis]MBI0576038.1 phosphoribosyltransferase family protein [Neobacillus cucumis]
MQKLQTSTLLKKKFTFNILDTIEVEVEVNENPYSLPVEDLFTMAARINKKRSFLFVSKVLGKHLPIDANKGLITAALLAARYLESVKGVKCPDTPHLLDKFIRNEPLSGSAFIPSSIRPVVIGFAETATALGHAFFDSFKSADFFHTTREILVGREPEITFEEEHSHATSHRCYIPKAMIQNEREIILVDDEMTTGKTALNIIQSIHSQFPRAIYTVVSILDWRSDEHTMKFTQLEKELGITIRTVSLIAGKVEVKQLRDVHKRNKGNERENNFTSSKEIIQLGPFFSSSDYQTSRNLERFIQETGRFGITSIDNQTNHLKISKAAAFLRLKRIGGKTLCLGTGEFMYIPMKLAAEMGQDVSYQSTTRSPIHIENKQGYGARFGVSFPAPEDPEITHFVYNIPPFEYDEVFVFFEREVDSQHLQPIITELEKLQIKSIKLIFFSAKRGEYNE